ncbi:hypothetical protein T01_2907 [Trichinella spiralis]|uniref:Uncharacterized protein n=1 Tax=Trichinella spiralis TaxID=6334 RepID=A0A0V1B3X5_TRISP|nr:hypothetical protein T01_13340 [Trichinella spiralis]KRY31734.1 hypothetical protein T01_2907 [Trichinella spiralis]
MAQLLSQPPHTRIPNKQKSNRRQPALHERTKTNDDNNFSDSLYTYAENDKQKAENYLWFSVETTHKMVRQSQADVFNEISNLFCCGGEHLASMYIFTAYISHVGY